VILRILRGGARTDDLGRLLEAVRADVDEWGATASGPSSFQAAWRPHGEEIEFLLVSIWPDPEAVLAKGGDISLPRGRLGATGALRDARAEHYELMLDMSYQDDRPCEVVRLSSMALVQRRSSAFYDHVRRLWDDHVVDAGSVALHVGRRTGDDVEQAVVVSIWETAAALEATTSGGFVGGEEMRPFYADEPTIEQFTALDLPQSDR
jgi:hypothetical protein